MIRWVDINGRPSWRWATVTAISPKFTVRLDGDAVGVTAAVSSTLTATLAVNDRVFVHAHARQLVIIGKANATDGTGGTPPPATGWETDTRDYASLSAALAATPPGGTLRIHGTHALASTVTVPADISLRGGEAAVISTTANIALLNLTAGTAGTIEGITFRGNGTTAQATLSGQIGIQCMTATAANPLKGLRVNRCTFENLQYICIHAKNVTDFDVSECTFRNYGYAGIGFYSASQGAIDGNRFTGKGMLPSYASNSYGVFLSTYEADGAGTSAAPFSTDVVVSNNIVRDQSWEALETHGGRRIAFIGNAIFNCQGAGISAVGHGSDIGRGSACRDINIANNVIVGIRGTSRMGIVLRGDPSNSVFTDKLLGTGSITGNVIYGCGDGDSLVTGGIHVANCEGVSIAGNYMRECRSSGVIMQDSPGCTVTGNTVVDVWRVSGTSSAFAYSLIADSTGEYNLVGNTLVRGSLTLADIGGSGNINLAGYHGTNANTVTCWQLGNVWPDGTAFGSSIVSRRTVFREVVEQFGNAAPTSGTWAAGDRILNSAPAASGFIGWVCTTAGTPGTWKTYGAISA